MGFIENLVPSIDKKVQEKKGEAILSFREFLAIGETTGDFAPPSTERCNYYEGGIIQGSLQEKEIKENLWLDIPTLFSYTNKSFYCSSTDYSIPVNRKINGFLRFGNGFNFKIEELENIEKGKILFSSFELGERSFFDRDNPRLQKFSLLVGDEEVGKFLEEQNVRNSDKFFKILKNPEYVRKRIENFHYDERKSFGESLSVTVRDVSQCFSEIKSLEESVLGAEYLVGREQNEGYAYWDRKSVGDYLSFRRDILEKIGSLNQQLEKGDQLYAKTNSPLINGKRIGFPCSITFPEYSKWVKEDLLPEINQKIEKIDKYLESKEKN